MPIQIIKLKCVGDQEGITIYLQTDQRRQYTARLTEEAMKQYEQIMSLWELYSVLQTTPIQELHSILSIQSSNILAIALVGIPNSTYYLSVKLPLSLQQSKPPNVQTIDVLQRLARVQEQNFQLKIRMQQTVARVQQQQQKINQILSFVKMEMLKFSQNFKEQVEEVSLMIQKLESYQSTIPK